MSFFVSLCLSLPLWVLGWSEAVLWGFCYSAGRSQTAPYITTLSVCLQWSVSSTGDWRDSPPLHTRTDTHSELIDPVPLSRKTFPLCPASTSTHPPPPPSWLNAYYLPLSPPLHFPYWYPSFSCYLYSSSSSFFSHSASFPPLCFPHYSYPSRAS